MSGPEDGIFSTVESLYGHLLPPKAEKLGEYEFLKAVYRTLDNKCTIINALAAYAAVPSLDDGLTCDLFKDALRHLACEKYGADDLGNRLLVQELSTVGVVFMPDTALEQMLTPDVISVLEDYDDALKQVYSFYSSPVIGVVMPWEEVIHSNIALQLDRFLSLAAALSLYPTVLSEEQLIKNFKIVRSNNEAACKRMGLDQEQLLFPHFQELLCRCADNYTVARGPRALLVSKRRGNGLLHSSDMTLAVRLDKLCTQLGFTKSTSDEQESQSRPEASAARDSLAEEEAQLDSGSSKSSWLIDTSETAAARIASLLEQLDLPPEKKKWSTPTGKNVPTTLLTNRPDVDGFVKVPQPLQVHMDLSGHKSTLIDTVVCAPPTPPPVASQLEAALVYHNSGSYSLAINAYKAAESVWVKTSKNGIMAPESKAFLLHAIGNVYHSKGDDEQALTYYMDARTCSEALAPGHTDRAISFDSIGHVSYHWGHYSLALRCFERAMEIREKVRVYCLRVFVPLWVLTDCLMLSLEGIGFEAR
jgi:tetratricopeptide (TPR) repeat protein